MRYDRAGLFQPAWVGVLVQCSAQVVMASRRSTTPVTTPRRMRRSVTLNQRSIRFSCELGVGVWFKGHRWRSVWAITDDYRCGVRGELSSTTCTLSPRGTLASICLKNFSTSAPVWPSRGWARGPASGARGGPSIKVKHGGKQTSKSDGPQG